MRTTVIIQNLKCDKCKHKLVSALDKFDSISNAVTNLVTGSLSFDYVSHNALEGLRIHLTEIGLPITEDPSIIGNSENDTDTKLTFTL